MFIYLFYVCFAHLSSISFSQPIIPTYWGTNSCDVVPTFSLQDRNTESGDSYNTVYGLDDFKPYTYDVLLVGLYFADSEDSWHNAEMQDELGQTLTEKGYKVKNVAINYLAPLSCVLEGECVNFWWNSPSLFPSYDNCLGYVAGCAPGDSRLLESNWQAKLAEHTKMPIFQDTDMGWIWDEFGGLQGDLYIYDTDGNLVSYLCNIENLGSKCEIPMSGGGLKDDDSYELAKKLAIAAAKIGSKSERCPVVDDKTENDGDDYGDEQEIYYVDDYYYYNGFGTNSESSFGKSISVSRRHTNHKLIHKIPTYVYAAIVAVLAFIITAIVLYCRWRRNKSRNMLNGGVVRFTQLPTDDDDIVFGNTAINADNPNPFLGARAFNGNDRYGSL